MSRRSVLKREKIRQAGGLKVVMETGKLNRPRKVWKRNVKWQRVGSPIRPAR